LQATPLRSRLQPGLSGAAELNPLDGRGDTNAVDVGAMRSLEAAIEIRASPEAVFDLIHDYARRLEWDPFLKEACLLEGAEAAGLGVKTRCTARNGFSGLAMETVYVSFDRPKVAAVRMTSGPAVLETFAASLRQENLEVGLTRVIYRFNFSMRPRWLGAIADPIASVLFRREMRRRLKALKSYLERSH
jgi:polyketide cyclase/dehydrase/lipid transport protein